MMDSLNPIYVKYNEELKPLVSEIEGRLETFEEPLLERIMEQFDYVALFVDEKDEELKSMYLLQAMTSLKLAVSASYQYLVYALLKKISLFKKRYGGKEAIERLSDGEYAGLFEKLEKNIQKNVRKGCRVDDNEALPYYKEAYEACVEQEQIVELMSVARVKKQKLVYSIVAALMSIAVSVGVGFWVERFLSCVQW
ncbi:MAG: hypothetical protein IJZ38_02510 [Bacteroides sp.]|nr:hypothetical protein [Bacteroides sp.]